MKVSFKYFAFLPVITVGLLPFISCSSAEERAKKYMAEKPYTEYEEVTKYSHGASLNHTLTQSKLDSVAYRDIFNGTEAAKNSALVTEFNKIASNMRGYSEKDGINTRYQKICQSIIQQGVTTKKFNEIKNQHSWHDGDSRRVNILQHYADDWAYRKFFTKAGVMNDIIARRCDHVSERIRP